MAPPFDRAAARGATGTVKRYLPWVVATALFMEQLDSTIVNTAVPTMAESLGVAPLSLKAVVASYIVSLAVGIPVSGWIADRFGTRRVFSTAVAIFTLASIACGLSVNVTMLVGARILQGLGAALMTPVGRLAIVRTFAKSELLVAMNFVIIPALIGPLLGPTVGGLIVHWVSWREIFFVNVPMGIAALVIIHRYMPDYRGEGARPLDFVGLVLFSSGMAILSWLLEIFGEHQISLLQGALLLALSLALLAAYAWHALQSAHPLLELGLFRLRTFRVSVGGGLLTRLGIGGMPFLLPLLYQLGLGLPAWESGLLTMPSALAAMGMKFLSSRVLRRYGFRPVLMVNTFLVGTTICLFSQVSTATPLIVIVLLAFTQGFFNSLQFSSVNGMAYADIAPAESSMATSIASTMQQLALSFGLASASLVAGWYLGNVPQTDPLAVTAALHRTFLTVGVLTMVSALVFRTLKPGDGDNVSRGKVPGSGV
ncbi:MAG TPA: DHA2 family efflux MFS transporter permease subunit [Casimicrobiaceae bacterium]|jgi:EmrB/QacA subfamily drug resistance transporter|nr:DHA2 family efflux MFS transporter permease subunit [Casimicrobiaceae bacterium]